MLKRKVKPIVIGDETFHVRSWSLRERLTFSGMSRDKKSESELAAFILTTSLCNESGELIYPDPSKLDLDDIDGEVGQQLFKEALTINGLGENAVESAKKD